MSSWMLRGDGEDRCGFTGLALTKIPRGLSSAPVEWMYNNKKLYLQLIFFFQKLIWPHRNSIIFSNYFCFRVFRAKKKKLYC